MVIPTPPTVAPMTAVAVPSTVGGSVIPIVGGSPNRRRFRQRQLRE